MSYEELLPGLDTASPFSTMSSASFDSAIGDMFGAALTPTASDTCNYGSPSKISIDSLLYEGACEASWPGPPTPPLSAPPYPGQLPPPPRLSVISGPAPHPGPHGHHGHHPHRHQRRKHEESAKIGARGPRQEVEQLCVRLMCGYQQCLLTIPPTPAPSLSSQHGDSLVLATRLLSEAVARMRLFLSGLDTFNSLTPGDRSTLYRHNVCSMQILKSSLSVDLRRCQNAFPLPYGENLGETEAFHLIRAFELYNELKNLISEIQALEIRELPVMLLIMMITFFKPPPISSVTSATGAKCQGPYMEQPERVERIHQFYLDKLHTYLHLRYGPGAAWPAINSIVHAVESVKNFCVKLKDFLDDVTSVGLQVQYEAVTENLSLIAHIIQSELQPEQGPS